MKDMPRNSLHPVGGECHRGMEGRPKVGSMLLVVFLKAVPELNLMRAQLAIPQGQCLWLSQLCFPSTRQLDPQ